MNDKYGFRINPIPSTLAQRARREMKDDHGHDIKVRRDGQRHQCRVCLQLTEPGERFLLMSYSPFDRDSPYCEVGPIFIHQRSCTPYPSDGGYPSEFPRHDVVLRAYNDDDEIEDAELVGQRSVEEVILHLLGNQRARYVHARNSTYGCFMFRIDRTP